MERSKQNIKSTLTTAWTSAIMVAIMLAIYTSGMGGWLILVASATAVLILTDRIRPASSLLVVYAACIGGVVFGLIWTPNVVLISCPLFAIMGVFALIEAAKADGLVIREETRFKGTQFLAPCYAMPALGTGLGFYAGNGDFRFILAGVGGALVAMSCIGLIGKRAYGRFVAA